MKHDISTALNHPIVIVGSPRSGTTLLRTMLEQHPDLLVHPTEPQFILQLYRRYGSRLPAAHAAVAHIAKHRYTPAAVDRQAFYAACDGAAPAPLREIIACYLRVWGGKALVARKIVLKHPALVHHLDLVCDLFSNPHIVHIVRDPRANVASQRARWPKFSVWECSMKWRNAVRAAQKFREDKRVTFTELRYEDLLLAPEQTMQNLCQSLDIPYVEALLSFNQRTTLYASGERAQELSFSGPDPSRLNVWRSRLSSSDIRVIEACCRDEMKWWGYEAQHPVSPTGFRLHLARQRIHYRYRTAGRAVKRALKQIGWRLGGSP